MYVSGLVPGRSGRAPLNENERQGTNHIYQRQDDGIINPSAICLDSITTRMIVIQPTSMSTSGVTPGTLRPPSFNSSFLGRRRFPVTKPSDRKRADRCMLRVNAGNANSGGLFAPVVIIIRDIFGKKRFNKFRGKAIQLHSQVRKLRFRSLPFLCRASDRVVC